MVGFIWGNLIVLMGAMGGIVVTAGLLFRYVIKPVRNTALAFVESVQALSEIVQAQLVSREDGGSLVDKVNALVTDVNTLSDWRRSADTRLYKIEKLSEHYESAMRTNTCPLRQKGLPDESLPES